MMSGVTSHAHFYYLAIFFTFEQYVGRNKNVISYERLRVSIYF